MNCRRAVLLLLVAALVGLFTPLAAPPAPAGAYPVQGSYKGEPLENCADPAVTPVPVGGYWYMYCTADPLNDADKAKSGAWNFHLIAILRSQDLLTWSYYGDALAKRPRWAAPDAGLWAPDIQFANGKWYLYFSVAGTIGRQRTGDRSAIGVATSSSPAGPFTDSGTPVVEAQPGRWVIDPFAVKDEATGKLTHILYGSYAGGISARQLSPDGLSSDPTTEKQIVSANRYEGAYVRKRGGYYYLFVSAADCCNERLTGYSVFVGRATSPLGPYVDREGRPLMVSPAGTDDGRVGGTPVLRMNGNRWVGTGHNSVLTDAKGQDWFVYHGINRADPIFVGTTDYNKRAPLLDRLDWLANPADPTDVWPTVRGGLGPSESYAEATLSQRATLDVPDTVIAVDQFDGSLGAEWSWVRQPADGTFGVEADPTKANPDNGSFRFAIQGGDLWKERNDASVLARTAPTGDFLVETRVRVDVPTAGHSYNYAQAGLVIYLNDDHYIKLTNASIWETRQTEFGKEMAEAPGYGNTVAGPPAAAGDWTYLRIVKRTNAAGEEFYTAYTCADGAAYSCADETGLTHWVRSGTWTHTLGGSAKMGLVAMANGSGVPFTANFDYVRVSTVTTVATTTP